MNRIINIELSYTVSEKMFEQWMGREVINDADFNLFVSEVEKHSSEYFGDQTMVESVKEYVNDIQMEYKEEEVSGVSATDWVVA